MVTLPCLHIPATTVILLIQPSHSFLHFDPTHPPRIFSGPFSEQKDVPLPTPLQPRINFLNHVVTRVIRPGDASLLDAVRQHPLLQLGHLLDRVDIQARAHMPRDVAMERPHAGVVRLVLQHDVTVSLHELHVAPLRVLLVDDGAVPGPEALGQDVEVVAVEVHGVGGGEVVVDDYPDRGVVAEVVGVPLRVEGVRDVALVGEDEHGVAGRR